MKQVWIEAIDELIEKEREYSLWAMTSRQFAEFKDEIISALMASAQQEESKVYLVKSSEGSYEDRYERIEKCFLNEVQAQKYVDKYNAALEEKQKAFEKCWNCPFGCGELEKNEYDEIKESAPDCFIEEIEVYETEELVICKRYDLLERLDMNEEHNAWIVEIPISYDTRLPERLLTEG